MKTSLDCIPCFVRQTLDAVGMVSTDPTVHARMLREVLSWISEIDLDEPPPVLGQRIHRRLREITGVTDPYRAAKDHQNRMAMNLLPDLKSEIVSSGDSLMEAARLAIAGNVIDMGVSSDVTESDVRQAIHQALAEPLAGEWSDFSQTVTQARNILYIADNAGEIIFDRLLIEQLSPERITLAVRGTPVINDATMADVRFAGLHEIVEVIDNGSDAPGTVLNDCSQDFIRHFTEADLILAKGQGNYETLSNAPQNIFFLFRIKCPVIANRILLPVGNHVLLRSRTGISDAEDPSHDPYSDIKEYMDE